MPESNNIQTIQYQTEAKINDQLNKQDMPYSQSMTENTPFVMQEQYVTSGSFNNQQNKQEVYYYNLIPDNTSNVQQIRKLRCVHL